MAFKEHPPTGKRCFDNDNNGEKSCWRKEELVGSSSFLLDFYFVLCYNKNERRDSMWIEDLTKAFWMLNGLSLICCVQRIENNVIYMTNGDKYSVKELVEEYDKEYCS